VPLFLQEQEAQRSKEVGPQDFDLQVQDMSKVRPARGPSALRAYLTGLCWCSGN